VIAFECLIGKRPFYSDAIGDLVLQICVREIAIPSKHGPVPDGFDAWFARACARDPELRFQSARELTEALRDALGVGGRETMATLSGAEPARSISSPTASESDPAPFSQAPTIAVSAAQQKPSLTIRQFGTTTKTEPPSNNSAAIVLGVAGAALAIGLVVGFLVLNRRGQIAPESGPLEFPAPTLTTPAKKAEPGPVLPEEVDPAGVAAPETESDALEPTARKDGGPRREGTGGKAPAGGKERNPVDAGGPPVRRDGGWKKPAWAIPDDELPPKAPPVSPPPTAAPPPAPSTGH